jgi:hypothetical protein
MRELQTGVWHWQARHPDWTPEESGPAGWGPDVSSYAIDTGERLLLFDPLAPLIHSNEPKLQSDGLGRDLAEGSRTCPLGPNTACATQRRP